MHVDLPTEAEVRALLETTDTTCVSIYMSATPQPDDANAERIAFKNKASEAIDQLRSAGIDKREVAAFEEAFTDLQEDQVFWRYQANSLAVLATKDEVNVYRLASRLEPHVAVADRFYIKPLLRAVTFPHAGFVLSLAQGSVRMFEFGGDYGPYDVEVADMPADLYSFMESVPGAEASAGFGVLSPEGRNTLLRKYARQVDRAVRAAVRGHELPVVLAATEPLASVFRSVTTLTTLADEGIVGNPERTPDGDLVVAARGVLDGVYAAEVQRLVELFDQRAGQNRTATDLADVARAATFGAVDTLIVDIDRIVPGTISDEGEIVLGNGPGSYGVVDEIARRVVLARGRVVAVRADEVPGGGEAAAILRYT